MPAKPLFGLLAFSLKNIALLIFEIRHIVFSLIFGLFSGRIGFSSSLKEVQIVDLKVGKSCCLLWSSQVSYIGRAQNRTKTENNWVDAVDRFQCVPNLFFSSRFGDFHDPFDRTPFLATVCRVQRNLSCLYDCHQFDRRRGTGCYRCQATNAIHLKRSSPIPHSHVGTRNSGLRYYTSIDQYINFYFQCRLCIGDPTRVYIR